MRWPFKKTTEDRAAKSASPSWSLFRPLSSWDIGTEAILAIPAVGRCVELIAGDVARVPVEVQARGAKGFERIESVVSQLLEDGPNDLIAGGEWRAKIIRDMMLYGEHLSVIVRTTGGEVLEVTPCERGTFSNYWDQEKQQLAYNAFGMSLEPSDVLHFRRAEREQFRGRGILHQHASTLKAIAQQYAAAERIFKTALPKIKLETEEPLSSEATARLQQSFRSSHGDASSWSTPVVVSAGMKVGEITTRLDQNQWVQAQDFGVADVARCFGVPVTMIDSTSSPTTEDISSYVENCLRPILAQLSAHLKLKMLVPGERVAFQTDQITHGTHSQQVAAARQMIDAGLVTPNEARAMLGLAASAAPGMDEVYLSKNYTEISAPGADDVGTDAKGGATDAS
jgi:HK97 family phage portal protein